MPQWSQTEFAWHVACVSCSKMITKTAPKASGVGGIWYPKLLQKHIRAATLNFHGFGIDFGCQFDDFLKVWGPTDHVRRYWLSWPILQRSSSVVHKFAHLSRLSIAGRWPRSADWLDERTSRPKPYAHCARPFCSISNSRAQEGSARSFRQGRRVNDHALGAEPMESASAFLQLQYAPSRKPRC